MKIRLLAIKFSFLILLFSSCTERRLKNVECPNEYLELFDTIYSQKLIHTFDHISDSTIYLSIQLENPKSPIFSKIYIENTASFSIFKIKGEFLLSDIRLLEKTNIKHPFYFSHGYKMANLDFRISPNFPTESNSIIVLSSNNIIEDNISNNILLLRSTLGKMIFSFTDESKGDIFLTSAHPFKKEFPLEIALIRANGYIYFVFYDSFEVSNKTLKLIDYLSI